jgi:hypothetical protein
VLDAKHRLNITKHTVAYQMTAEVDINDCSAAQDE